MTPHHGVILLFAAALVCACGPGIQGGPTMSNKVEDEDEDPPPPEIQSNDILAREQVTTHAEVKHILVGWQGLGDEQDARAKKRTRAEADQLAVELLGRVRAGESFEILMAEYSEDPGSALDGSGYTVTPEAGLVFEFKRLGLRLNVGEAGLVMTRYGWHIMKRVE